jgi:hypothetical protein
MYVASRVDQHIHRVVLTQLDRLNGEQAKGMLNGSSDTFTKASAEAVWREGKGRNSKNILSRV